MKNIIFYLCFSKLDLLQEIFNDGNKDINTVNKRPLTGCSIYIFFFNNN